MRAEATAAARHAAAARARRQPFPWRRLWLRCQRWVYAVLLLAVGVLLARFAREVDWPAVWQVLRGYDAATLLGAGALALAAHLLYGCHDLIGRRHLGHGLSMPRTLATACVCYAVNLNLGALVGGVALRWRLYTRQGLQPATVAQVWSLSLLGNWLGWLVLAGAAFALFPLPLPPHWPLGSTAQRALGLVFLALATAYIGSAFLAKRREWTLRGQRFALPSGPTALGQLAVSCAHWASVAGVVAVLLPRDVGYAHTLAVLLVAAVAGVVAHVPAGLGVLEAVFIALLAGRVPQPVLLAALLACRGLYYLVPLGLALGVVAVLELQARRTAASVRSRKERCSPSGA